MILDADIVVWLGLDCERWLWLVVMSTNIPLGGVDQPLTEIFFIFTPTPRLYV
jgi:hypothetical protein